MEKIKITKEQKEVLESYKVFIRELKTDGIQYFIDNFKYWQIEFKPLQTFTPEQFLKLLCGWYEVEQPFKVGDWVYSKTLNYYVKVSEIKCNPLSTKPNEKCIYYEHLSSSLVRNDYISNFEKVTEPWKIMLLELGRAKPEFKKGDKIETIKGNTFTVYMSEAIQVMREHFESGEAKYFYPVESRIEVKQ